MYAARASSCACLKHVRTRQADPELSHDVIDGSLSSWEFGLGLGWGLDRISATKTEEESTMTF